MSSIPGVTPGLDARIDEELVRERHGGLAEDRAAAGDLVDWEAVARLRRWRGECIELYWDKIKQRVEVRAGDWLRTVVFRARLEIEFWLDAETVADWDAWARRKMIDDFNAAKARVAASDEQQDSDAIADVAKILEQENGFYSEHATNAARRLAARGYLATPSADL